MRPRRVRVEKPPVRTRTSITPGTAWFVSLFFALFDSMVMGWYYVLRVWERPTEFSAINPCTANPTRFGIK